mmetsp:Transcript_62266/g.138699  ORF Transcript_62266/g.138699 Transcript_62266/m.138699 type:complete len:110 (-) Transcript_62266:468-797(-)
MTALLYTSLWSIALCERYPLLPHRLLPFTMNGPHLVCTHENAKAFRTLEVTLTADRTVVPTQRLVKLHTHPDTMLECGMSNKSDRTTAPPVAACEVNENALVEHKIAIQ